MNKEAEVSGEAKDATVMGLTGDVAPDQNLTQARCDSESSNTSIQSEGTRAAAASKTTDTPRESTNVLEKVRALVRDKTRFEPEDIHLVRENIVEQEFQISVTYGLLAKVANQSINGFFVATQSDHQSSSPDLDAQADVPNRLRQASRDLRDLLSMPHATYDSVKEGLLTAHSMRHWHLHVCNPCGGKGQVQCHTCHGNRKETCPGCYGNLVTPCDVINCFGGRVNCLACGGSGQRPVQESYSVPTQTTVNGITSYGQRTEYRTVYHRCVNPLCSGGKVQCFRCSGTGRIQCQRCGATGKVTCRTCGGDGKLTCSSCTGSGKKGSAAWVDVYSTPDYLLILPEEADLAAKDIEKKVQVHGVAEIAKGISLEDIAVDVPDNPEMVTAKYQGGFRIFHTDVTCNGKEYHLIAYAEDLRWLELDKIVETLLRNDLDELNGAIVEASDEDWYATRLDHLLQPLKHVVASEINFELVKATFDPEYQGKFDVVVSADYRAEASKGVLGSLRCIYNRLAKQFWWKALLASIVIELAAWSFGRDYWAGLLGLICVPLSWVLFTRRVRAVLTDALGNRTQADKAMTITSKGKERKAIAFAAVCAPCALVAIAMWISLPSHGPWSGAFGGKASSASPMPIEPLETAKRTSNPMADVTANGRSSPAQLAQIRQALEARANSGDVQAYGPYARAVLDNTGLSTPLPPKVRFSEAKKWAELALQSRADDVEALTVKGLILVMGLGVTENQSEGLSLLTRAANEGGTHAMHVLGMCRFGVHYCDRSATNYSEARKWFSKAAAKDSPEDIYNLGLMDWNGYGIPKPNRQSAMLLWKKAAAMGEERALRAVSQGRPPN